MSADGEMQRRKLNIVEGAVLAGIVALVASNLLLRDAMIKLQVSSQYTTEEIRSLKLQLADVPALNQRVSRLEVRQDANAEAIKELRAIRRLK